MDDGDASAFRIILFLALLFIEAVLTGFNKAIHLMNEKEIERKAEEEKAVNPFESDYGARHNLY